MSEADHSSTPSNRLLHALSEADRDLLLPLLHPVELERDKDLEEPGELIQHVYFLDSGIASTVGGNHGSNDRPIEIGLIGREGVTGMTVILGDHRSLNSVFMQVGGDGHRIGVEDFRNAIAASPRLHALLLKYVQVFMTQITQTAVSNGRSKIEERLARWLLMADDRLDTAELPLTHEFLAIMLGVRLIDRDGLIEHANGCYGVAEREYRRLIGDGAEP